MLTLPVDAKGNMPNCGLTAMAVACGITLEEATQDYQKACNDILGRKKQGNWKGRTHAKIRYKAMVEYIGVDLETVDFQRGNLRSVIKQLDNGCKYIVTTTGHVQVVENDSVIDQSGVSSISDYWGSGKQVKSILKVVENNREKEDTVLTFEEKKRKIEERKQLDMVSSILNYMHVAISEDDCYEFRERTLEELYEELQEYFGEGT